MQKITIPRAKRLFDILVGSLMAFILLPVAVGIVVAIVIEAILVPESRGPVFYSEVRISRGEQFRLYKFRIFKIRKLEQARLGGVVHTKQLEQSKDTMTHVGRVLKQIYMDEMPQLFNVLKGDMTLVGPRPTNLENAAKLLVEGKYSKHIFIAGVTGYFQSHKGLTLHQDQEALDMRYVRFVEQNPGWKVVLYDLKILLVSVLTILRAEGI